MLVKNRIIKVILPLWIICLAFLSLGMKSFNLTPKTVYHVYLKGKSIGLIESKKALEKYIDKEQESLKEKYQIDRVYVPDNLDIKKEITYNNQISSPKEIYEKIKDSSSFTIDGYKITIKLTDTTDAEGKKNSSKEKIIYVINKSVFTKAIDKTVKSFVTTEDYNTYKSNKKQTIKDTGKIIENIYIQNDITIRKGNIPTNEKIYTDIDELSKYLLFGTANNETKYVTNPGDTITDIAYNNKMSNEEFLIINPGFQDENALLYAGQEVNIGILNPQISIVQEEEVVEMEEKKYQTETRYDNTKMVGYEETTQEGVNGQIKVTKQVQKINGETTNIVRTAEEVITPAVNAIVVKGGKQSSYTYIGGGTPVPTSGSWGWPATCNSVSSPFGYRWGILHDGTDIAGCGYGTNIFAAESGTVVESRKKTGYYPGGYGDNGEYIIIDHHNGYYSLYAHLCPGCRYVRAGDNVVKGQVIGGMGNTGAASGVHLHFALWYGYPYRGGRALNAMSLY